VDYIGVTDNMIFSFV